MTIELTPGQLLGDHELLARAGAGGFSEVWKARRVAPAGDGALVAIKVPRVPDLVDHLRREAFVQGRVRDPQVVPLVEVALDHDPPFLVMPWVEGTPVPLLGCAPAPRDQLAAFELALDLARTLSRLHAQGVFHGDIKPTNVVVAGGRVHVLDLGLGQVQVETRLGRSLAQSLVSVDGKAIGGTLDYMAPELFGGADERPAGATAAADVYAMGVLLHHQLTGRPPAFGVAPASLNAYLPSGCEDLLRRMLAQAPSRRASAAAVVSELERLVVAERRCGARKNGHERRRVRDARLRTLQVGLRGLAMVVALPAAVVLLALASAPLMHRWRDASATSSLILGLVLVPGSLAMLVPITLAVTTINAWLVGIPEKTYKERRGHPWWSFMMQ